MTLNPKTLKNFIAALIWVLDIPLILLDYRSFQDGLILGLIGGALIFVVLQLISDQPFYKDWFETIFAAGIGLLAVVPVAIWLLGQGG